MTIKELFSNWVDYDIAMYYLACLLGMMKYEDKLGEEWWKAKGVFNTNNEMSNMFFDLLERMVQGGILEKNDVLGYRWNKAFTGTHYWKMESNNSN